MNRKFFLSLVITLCSATFSFAAGDVFSGDNFKVNRPAAKAVVPAASSSADVITTNSNVPAEWTVMVFVNGKNNLEKFALSDLNEMEKIGSTQKVNIVVEIGRMDGYDTSDGDWKGVRRYLVKKDTDTTKVTSPMLADLGMKDMGDYNTAIEFGRWAKKKFPAKKYMFVLWNHGSGWIKSVKTYGMNKGISYDDQSNNHIDTPQMGQILKAIGGANVYGSDACLMQMTEVAYELKDYVQYIVGSEETEPGDGWTYDAFLGPLVSNPEMDGAALAKAVVDAYAAHYNKFSFIGYTQSYVNAKSLIVLRTLVNALASDIIRAKDYEAFVYARDNAVKFEYSANKDLYDFTRLLVSKSKNDKVKETGTVLMKYLSKKVVGYNQSKDQPQNEWTGAPAKSLGSAKGIAIYIPNHVVPDSYKELKWAEESNWDDFINTADEKIREMQENK